MKILIAGHGFVGKAHHEKLKETHEVSIHDPALEHEADFSNIEAVICCVSTPSHDNGSCNINNVYDIIEKTPKEVPILIKSTISLEGWIFLKETFPHHSLNFSPEFLRAENHLDDFENMNVLYLSEERATWWAKIFAPLWQDIKFVVARPEELILMKYFRNSFLALKVSFFNQVYDLCEATGVSFDEVKGGITQDERIGLSHSSVNETRGWGGHCFPKDTAALLKTAEKYNTDLSIIKEAINYNSLIRRE